MAEQASKTTDKDPLAARTYLVKHLDPKKRTKSYDQDAWIDNGHTITIIQGKDGHKESKGQLFVNHEHIHPENWQWINKPNELVWEQRKGSLNTAGHIGFSHDATTGSGSMYVASESERSPVLLDYQHPTYSFDLSKNAGAYVTKEGNLTLKWDTSSKEWENATWDDDVMTFKYWLEKGGKIGDQQLWQTAIVFNDNKLQQTWDVQPRGPGGSGAANSQIDSSGQFLFDLNPGYTPPVDSFPLKMVFNFDQLAQNIEGGAMLCHERSVKGDVYALKGKVQNHLIAGTYQLTHQSSSVPTNLSTHRQKLVIDGNTVEKSGVSGNKLWWQDLSPDHAKKSNLPTTGFVQFSADGNSVTKSSFKADGYRSFAVLTNSSSDLNIQGLLNMNPYGSDSDGNTVDMVQQSAMEGFYKIIQYYMPSDYLHNFIAAEPPDLGDIEDIARNSSENGPWYTTLSVPYLVNALKQSNNDSVKYLNARRAQAVMKEAISNAKVYKNQAASLYSHEWQKKFPLMSQYIIDQAQNTEEQHNAITEDSKKWIADIQEGIEETTIEDEKKQLQQMVDLAQNIRDKGLQGQYWSYILFRYLSSPAYLSMLQMQLLDGNTSQALTLTIQRYSSVLSILDSSGFFMEQFLQVMQIYQLTALLPSMLDVGNNFEETTFFMELITQAFIKKYVDSTDPQMQKYAKEVQDELNTHKLQEYFEILNEVAGVVGSNSWQNLNEKFQSQCVKKFGAGFTKAANMVMISAAASTIFLMGKGVVKWDDMTTSEKADFVVGCIDIVTLFLRKGIQARVVFQATDSTWQAFKVLFGADMRLQTEQINSIFGRWIAEQTGARMPNEIEMLTRQERMATFEYQYPRVCKMFGRNLEEFMATRFAAFMSVVGIGLAVLGLADSEDQVSEAMNSLFLIASVLDMVSAAAGWALSSGIATVGGLSIASIASLASALSIFAAFAGIVIMMVIMFTHKDPPDPIDQFVKSDDVKKGGYYMEHCTAIDYFQVITDESGKARSIGIAMNPSDTNLYLTVNPDGSLSTGVLSHAYSTVLSTSTDYKGQSIFLTKVWGKDNKPSILTLTLDDTKQLSMKGTIDDSKKQTQQRWKATCTGNVKEDDKQHLESASFTIENVYWPGVYLTYQGTSIVTGETQQVWNLSMQGMKPEMLTFPNIILSTYDKDRSFSPYLGQVGTISGSSWSVEPALPDFLKFDDSNGTITQKAGLAPPTFPKQHYTITVKNDFGNTSAGFDIQVISTG
ncbi:uncharacterized protein [Ptychodera flava]|uniref:uncharacterized protein n=1 Tax=Ptychodera flava TaxID=63121 RepID=UPI00396A4FF9